MPYARIGPQEWEWVPDGQAYFEYTGPAKVWPKPWEKGVAVGIPKAPPLPVVELGTRPVAELEAALASIVDLPNLTGNLRQLARQFGEVSGKIFVDTASRAGVNPHTATKQFRLGRKGIT